MFFEIESKNNKIFQSILQPFVLRLVIEVVKIISKFGNIANGDTQRYHRKV